MAAKMRKEWIRCVRTFKKEKEESSDDIRLYFCNTVRR